MCFDAWEELYVAACHLKRCDGKPQIQMVSLHFKGAAFDLVRPPVSGASVTEGFHRLTSHLHGKAGGEIPAAQKSSA